MTKMTNRDNLALPIAVWSLMDTYEYDERPNVISVTTLLKPVRQIVLGKKYKDCMKELDASDLVASSMGTALHDSVENAWNKKDKVIKILDSLGYANSEALYDAVILERRSEKEINGHIISGQFDIAYNGFICDIKSTSVYSYIFGSKEEDYKLQMSIYKWLNKDIITKDVGYIEYIFTDWSAVKAKQDSQYPQKRIISHKIELLNLEDTQTYIEDKLNLVDHYMALEDKDLIECSKEELWQKDEKWKVYNPNISGTVNMKRATRVFDNESDANKFVKSGGKVVKFEGGAKRCNYCNYINICEQYIKLQMKGQLK